MRNRAQSALLAIPGHAEYFRDEILEARAIADAGILRGDFGSPLSKLSYVQNVNLQTLGQLPSVETVRVLGELLYDDRGLVVLGPNPTPKEREDAKVQSAISRGAGQALQSLPLTFKPVKLPPDYPVFKQDHVPAWRLWYEQVKAGNRTFRFEGDPTEYDLDGPASAEKLAAIGRDQRRDANRAAGHRKSQVPGDVQSAAKRLHEPATVIGISIAGVLCAAAGWYFLRQRRPS